MTTQMIFLILLLAGVAAFFYGRMRARAMTVASAEKFHSRPGHHGFYVTIWTMLPAFFLIVLWLVVAPLVVRWAVTNSLPEAATASGESVSLIMTTVEQLSRGVTQLEEEDFDRISSGAMTVQEVMRSKGVLVGSDAKPYMLQAAILDERLSANSHLFLTLFAGITMIGGFLYGRRGIAPRARARNAVEQVMTLGLIAASTVAILTTAGIVLSVLFESIEFFRMVPPADFFFGTVWDPRFSAPGRVGGSDGQFGILPLLWGTAYISLVALMVAVPIGLMSAIYMSEYAGNKVRSIAKPLLEILAGIPTIVYGFFALVTFGPFLRDAGGLVGFDIQASSVLTAGFVMGIMIIPFVSSLSDDIISAVPQSLREGSYGLGATQSETIKQVIMPAALPGVVGAVLLAASRAIGETMIVVLAAGIAANITLNPGESVTTVTVKIVSQLTGDLEFNSPQTLVAFALGLTLFVVTLGLNVFALYIVRKYREQYE
ncbi:phosphate transport system permease protein [Parvibaculum indicum]|uniref:phosphate ABC transporter permease subunit PstC n=1 Tax=Parvibaculum indicum TaxID=562969 RepID=UPI0014246687|nr:phosphate ABC transporter permease subunit PstC [Parvibaculum indicum]NIJ40887.1 phosphate transport system permease protein [Parvibaculum indicum]